MTISTDEVIMIARLARLTIAETDLAAYAKQLSGILDFVAQMSRVDTSGVEPMAHPLDIRARFRPDQVTETDQRDLFQGQAPQVERGLYLVPRVIE